MPFLLSHKISFTLPRLHLAPVHPGAQLHCPGVTQVPPLSQEGVHRSQLSPSHPLMHWHCPGRVQFPGVCIHVIEVFMQGHRTLIRSPRRCANENRSKCHRFSDSRVSFKGVDCFKLLVIWLLTLCNIISSQLNSKPAHSRTIASPSISTHRVTDPCTRMWSVESKINAYTRPGISPISVIKRWMCLFFPNEIG